MVPDRRNRGDLKNREKGGSLARTVLGGTGLIASAGGISKLFTLVSAPILTRELGPSPYGVVALLGTVTSLATTVALLGVDMSYSRFFFAGDAEEAAAVERFCWRFTMAGGVVVSLVAALAWFWGSAAADLPPGMALMVAVGVFLAVLNTMATTRQRLRGAYLRIAASIIVSGLVGTVLAIALALSWRKDAWVLLIGAAAGVAVGTLVARIPPREILSRGSGLPAAHRREILSLGLAGAVTAPMYWVMNSADRWFLGFWHGQGVLGVYAFAATVGLVGIMVNSAVTITWFPEMTRFYEASKKEAAPQIGRMWARLVTGLMVVWLAVSASGGDVIRLLADRRFHEGASLVPWLAGGVLFYGVASLANTGLAIRKTLIPAAGWWILGAVLNVFMNYLLVRPFGAYGAAVAACGGYALVAAGAMWSSQSRYHLPVPWARLAGAGVTAFIAGVAMFGPWAVHPALSLFLKFPVGVACAAFLMWIVAPDWMARLRWRETILAWIKGRADRT
jgi:O-antigen/teichoic acid export membrane protein